MSRVRAFAWRVRRLFGAHRQVADLRHEIDAHIDEATEDYLQRGLTPADARRAALLDFGGIARTEEAYREHLAFRWIDAFTRDVRHAARALRRSPGFAFVVVLVLAVGTGASTAVFTLLDRIVLQPLPFPDADRLVTIAHAVPGRNLKQAGISDGLFFFYRQHARSIASLGLYTRSTMSNLHTDSGTVRIEMRRADPEFFRVLGVQPALGRLFTDEDGAPGFMDGTWAIPILLTHDFWLERFGSDPAVVGRTLTINDLPRPIVGVLPAGFSFPDAHTQIWELDMPSARSPRFAQSFRYNAIARLRPGVTASAASADLDALLPHVIGVYPDATAERMAKLRVTPIVTPLKNTIIGDIAYVLWPLLGGMACLLLIAATNAGGLFLVRAEQRSREIAIRRALGAEWGRIASQFFIEALVLTLTASALAIAIARAVLKTVIAYAPLDLPRAGEIRLGWTASAFAFGAALVIAGAYSVMALRRLRRPADATLLRSGQWTTSGPAGRRRDPLIVVQLAMALLLLAGSALMVRTYQNLSRTPLGFSPDHLLTVEVSLPFRQADRATQVYDAVVDRLRHVPGVTDASAASFVPLTPAPDLFPVTPGGDPISFKFFVPGYFQAMGTRVVEGDAFGPNDHSTSPYPVLVSASLARHLFPDGHAVGRQIRRLNPDGTPVDKGPGKVVPPFTIVGVAGDVREATLRGDATETVYIPLIEPRVEQEISPTDMTLVIRGGRDPMSLAADARAAIAGVDPALGIGRVRSMDAIVEAARGKETFVGVLLILAAAVSLLLGIVGVYGAVAQVVRSRTREIGIRIALGATRTEVVRMVTAGSLRAAIVGAVIGLGLALIGVGALRALLFGVAPRDTVVLASVTVLLLTASALAACAAGWRAVRITPLVAMRDE
ncbi:MAG: ADOP family duplicated permease [Vicinamibacterales bacterium]